MTQDSAPQPASQPPFPPPQVRPPSPGPVVAPAWWNTPPSWFTLIPRRHSLLRRFITGLLSVVFLMSLGLNFYLMAILGAQLGQSFSKTTLTQGSETQTIAVYGIRGLIDDSAAISFEKFASEIVKDKTVKAVVLRVVTPGGTVSGSDEITVAIKKLKEAGRTVVVSMGSMAASGGYYISAGADEIIAEPATITGSIGVIAEWMVFKGTLDKIGAESVVIKSTNARNWKDEISPFKAPEQHQVAHMQSVLDQMQERFEKVVKDGRGSKLKPRPAAVQADKAASKPAEIEPFNGKIYLAKEAMELGLVDDIGYQSTAIERAGKLAGLTNPTVVQYSKRRGMLEQMFDSSASGASRSMFDTQVIDDMKTPKILMLWRPE